MMFARVLLVSERHSAITRFFGLGEGKGQLPRDSVDSCYCPKVVNRGFALAKLDFRRIPALTVSYFATKWANDNSPVHVAGGAVPRSLERIPNMIAFANPAMIGRRLE